MPRTKQVEKQDILRAATDVIREKGEQALTVRTEKLTGNYKYVTAKNKTDLVNGDLVLVNSDHPFTGTAENTDTIYSYLFDKS